MTILTPILYADGALRLTDHGPRGGGLVLVLKHGDWSGQETLNSAKRAEAVKAIETMLSVEVEPEEVFEHVATKYAAFKPFYHD